MRMTTLRAVFMDLARRKGVVFQFTGTRDVRSRRDLGDVSARHSAGDVRASSVLQFGRDSVEETAAAGHPLLAAATSMTQMSPSSSPQVKYR